MHEGTPDSDDGLRIERSTKPEDVRAYVERRTKSPLHFEDHGVTVWNYATHEPAVDALKRKAETLQQDRYIVPYQVPGAWGYMQDLLPDGLRNAELLVYSKREGRYKAFPNFRRLSSKRNNLRLKLELTRWMNEDLEVEE